MKIGEVEERKDSLCTIEREGVHGEHEKAGCRNGVRPQESTSGRHAVTHVTAREAVQGARHASGASGGRRIVAIIFPSPLSRHYSESPAALAPTKNPSKCPWCTESGPAEDPPPRSQEAPRTRKQLSSAPPSRKASKVTRKNNSMDVFGALEKNVFLMLRGRQQRLLRSKLQKQVARRLDHCEKPIWTFRCSWAWHTRGAQVCNARVQRTCVLLRL